MNDILMDETGDLALRADKRDFAFGDACEEIVQRVLLANKGEFKEYPLLGADLQKMINGSVDPFWHTQTKEMLQSCGLPVSLVQLTDNEITIQ